MFFFPKKKRFMEAAAKKQKLRDTHLKVVMTYLLVAVNSGWSCLLRTGRYLIPSYSVLSTALKEIDLTFTTFSSSYVCDNSHDYSRLDRSSSSK